MKREATALADGASPSRPIRPLRVQRNVARAKMAPQFGSEEPPSPRTKYLRWRDDHFLAHVTKILVDAPDVGQVELQDLYNTLGHMLGYGTRAGSKVRERWIRCSAKRIDACDTCQTTPGHGPYLQRCTKGKWYNIDESPDARADRRTRALREHAQAETNLALALLEEAHASASSFLTGEAARIAERQVIAHLIP